MDPTHWMDQAACKSTPDPDTFFPSKGGSARHARAICATCPVSAECAAYVNRFSERYGVWGGTTPTERRPSYQPPKGRHNTLTPTPRPVCDFPGCGRPAHGQNLCNAHLIQLRRRGTLTPLAEYRPRCSVPGCRRKIRARGLCTLHYQQRRRGRPLTPITRTYNTNPPDTCTYPGCDRPHSAKGYCKVHYQQHRAGKTLAPITPRRRTGDPK